MKTYCPQATVLVLQLLLHVACNSDRGDTGTTTDAGSSDSGSTTAPSGSTTANSTTANSTTANSTAADSTAADSAADSTTTGAPACPDVEFVYSIGVTAMLPPDCYDAIDGNTCAVTQTGCDLVWGCNGAFEDLLPPGSIDASGVYVGEGTFMSMPFSCTIAFQTEPRSFEFECSGGDLVCTGSGF